MLMNMVENYAWIKVLSGEEICVWVSFFMRISEHVEMGGLTKKY
jgi:hypothetical protein